MNLRSHLTYANVMATIAVFIAISGGTAVALNGANTVQSDDLGPGAQVRAEDVATNAIGSGKVVNESLTGADIKNQSGVDTCKPPTTKYGPICAHSDGAERTWDAARAYCTGLGLRLPSNSEAASLARNYDVPGVGTGAPIFFWTDDETFTHDADGPIAAVYSEEGTTRFFSYESTSRETVCVTDPAA